MHPAPQHCMTYLADYGLPPLGRQRGAIRCLKVPVKICCTPAAARNKELADRDNELLLNMLGEWVSA
jgi:hypothetical protein